MTNLNTELEMGMVATTLVVMLCMTVWLFFSRKLSGENFLPVKMMPIADNKKVKDGSDPLFLTSRGRPSNYLFATHDGGAEVLKKSMRLLPLPQKGASSINMTVERISEQHATSKVAYSKSHLAILSTTLTKKPEGE